MTAGKLETQISKDDGVVIIGTLLVCDDDRKLETQILNDGGDLIGTLLVCDDARKSQILGTLLYDDGCVQPITNRLYDNDPVMLYFEHYLMMKVVLYLEHYLYFNDDRKS